MDDDFVLTDAERLAFDDLAAAVANFDRDVFVGALDLQRSSVGLNPDRDPGQQRDGCQNCPQ